MEQLFDSDDAAALGKQPSFSRGSAAIIGAAQNQRQQLAAEHQAFHQQLQVARPTQGGVVEVRQVGKPENLREKLRNLWQPWAYTFTTW